MENNNFGQVKISNDVIATIAGLAAIEVEGVGTTSTFTDKLLKNNGVKIQIEEDEVILDVMIIIDYGISIPDIDCYNSKYTKDAVQYFLEHDLYGYKIPRPNYLIDSGRGLYYIVLIKPVPSMALPLWYAVQRYSSKTFTDVPLFEFIVPTILKTLVGSSAFASAPNSFKVLNKYL